MKVWTAQEEAERLAARFVGINQAAFARMHDIPGGASMVSQHIKGRRPLNLVAASAYAKGFHVSLEEISPRLADEVAAANKTISGPPAPYRVSEKTNVESVVGRGGVPLISWVQAGAWNEVADSLEPGDADEWLPCPVKHGPRSFCLRIRGDSMRNPDGRPTYDEGDVIFVDPDQTVKPGDRGIFRLDDEMKVTFKQYMEEEGRRYLKALNPAWMPRLIFIDGNATVCGKVIGKWSPE